MNVVTSFPNFPGGRIYAGYRQSLFKRELVDGVDVVRVPTLVFANRGFVLRVLDFLSFMIAGSIGSLFVGRPDVVVATSPQFFTGVAGWLVSRIYRCPFLFEVRDLWPDSIVAVGAMKEGVGIRMIRRIEKFLYRQAELIVVVTRSSRDVLIDRGVSSDKIIVITNGIDMAAFGPGPPSQRLRLCLGVEHKIVVSYIGNVGMAHGLQLILDAASQCSSRLPEVQFVIVGTGAELATLQQQARKRDLENVTFVGQVPHAEILEYWRLSDITLVLLRDTSLFRTVLPSKVFEAMATGTPIITNVQGELDSILRPAGAAVVIEPDNVTALVDSIEELVKDPARRNALSAAGVETAKHYDRNELADRMLAAMQMLKRNTADARAED
ncbi:MAG: glycosyltransferase family 4 protein [Bradyrhizobium sp.]|nr:glycosyltransferase family 4 protein [Bradyrhizobium sp.]